MLLKFQSFFTDHQLFHHVPFLHTCRVLGDGLFHNIILWLFLLKADILCILNTGIQYSLPTKQWALYPFFKNSWSWHFYFPIFNKEMGTETYFSTIKKIPCNTQWQMTFAIRSQCPGGNRKWWRLENGERTPLERVCKIVAVWKWRLIIPGLL